MGRKGTEYLRCTHSCKEGEIELRTSREGVLGAWQGKGSYKYIALSIFVNTVSVLAYQRSRTSYGIRLLK